MKKVKVILKTAVTFQGRTVEAGEALELPEKSAQALIDEGNAVEEGVETTETGQDDAGETSEGENTLDDEEAVEKLKKALNDQYKRDELAEAAKNAGVEFAYDAKKGEIVEAVVAAEKAEALLK